MNKQDAALVKETKALIKEVEAGDTEHAAWVAIQDRVKLLAEDRTQTEVGKLLGKGRTWVNSMLTWDAPAGTTPHSAAARGTDKGDSAKAKKVLRDPEQRKKVIAELDHETRHALIEDVWQEQDEDLGKDPVITPEGERAYERNEDEKKARRQIDKALWALKARLELYGDIPLDEHEKAYLPMIRTLLDRLENGNQMDDELKELIESAS